MIPAVPIRRSLTRIIVLASFSVVVVATLAFCMTEFVTFRRVSAQQLQILSQAIATNSTASLAFDNAEDAACYRRSGQIRTLPWRRFTTTQDASSPPIRRDRVRSFRIRRSPA
jgi:hypothetical protein